MSRADYLAALHAAFDARRDPLDDAAVRDWLAAHPEDLAEFAAMRVALTAQSSSQLQPAPVLEPQRRSLLWPMIFPPLAAAAALVLFLRGERSADTPPVPSVPEGILAVSESWAIRPASPSTPNAVGAGVLTASVTYTRNSAF